MSARSARPASFLHPTLSAWRAAKSSHRAIAVRVGAFVLSEYRSFDRYEASFATADAARWAIASGDIPWKLVQPVKTPKWNSG